MRHVFPLFAFVVIGCAPLLTPGEDTKDSAAIVKAEQLSLCAKTWSTRNENATLETLDVLAVYHVDGESGLIDPWGQKFQFKYVIDPETGEVRLVIWTTEPKSGRVIAAPKQLAHLVEPPK